MDVGALLFQGYARVLAFLDHRQIISVTSRTDDQEVESAAVVMPSAAVGHRQWRCDVSGDVLSNSSTCWFSFSQEGRGDEAGWRH